MEVSSYEVKLSKRTAICPFCKRTMEQVNTVSSEDLKKLVINYECERRKHHAKLELEVRV